MSESRASYAVTEDTGEVISMAWIRLIKRLVGLHRGRTYMITITVPDGDREPTWAIVSEGKTENDRG